MKKNLFRHLIMFSKLALYGFLVQLISFNTLLATKSDA